MVFLLVQKNLSILGIDRTKSMRSYRLVLAGCLSLGVSIVLHFKFLYSEAKDFKEITESIFISSVTVISLWCFISLVHKSDELFEFIDWMDNLVILFKETLIEEYPNALPPVLRAIQLIEKSSEIIYLLVTFVTPVCFIMPKYVYCIYCYFATDAGRDSFELMNHVEWFPFDWKNPLGYSLATAFQLTLMTYTLFIIANLASFGIGCFLVGITVTKQIENVLETANKKISLKAERNLALKRFKTLVEWQSIVKQMITDFSNLFRGIFLAAFIWSVIAICVTMLLVQVELTLNELNSMMLLALLIDVSYAFGFVFIVCELCQQFCDGFHKMDDVIGQFSWLSYPNEIQRLLPMLINSTQQPVDLKVFGSITCSRETFKKIASKAFNYFMTIRNFY